MKEKKNCNVEIGKRLKRIRENMNYSQAEFAEILDVSDDHYRRMESGASGLTVEKLQLLFEKLHVDSNYLVNGQKRDDFDLDAYLASCDREKRDELLTRCLEYIGKLVTR